MAFDFLPVENYRVHELVTGPTVQMPAGMRLAYVFMQSPSQGEWLVTPPDYLAEVVLQRSDDGGATWVDWDWDTFEGGRMASDGSGRMPFIARGENTPLTAPVLLRCTFQHNQRRRMGLLGEFSVNTLRG